MRLIVQAIATTLSAVYIAAAGDVVRKYFYLLCEDLVMETEI